MFRADVHAVTPQFAEYDELIYLGLGIISSKGS